MPADLIISRAAKASVPEDKPQKRDDLEPGQAQRKSKVRVSQQCLPCALQRPHSASVASPSHPDQLSASLQEAQALLSATATFLCGHSYGLMPISLNHCKTLQGALHVQMRRNHVHVNTCKGLLIKYGAHVQEGTAPMVLSRASSCVCSRSSIPLTPTAVSGRDPSLLHVLSAVHAAPADC